MADELLLGWGLDPATRTHLRLQRTRDAMRARRFDEAVVEAEELLDDDPRHVDALWLLAEAAMELRDFITAVQAYRSIISQGQPRPAVLASMASACFECAEFDDAEHHAKLAIAACPDLPEPHHILGLCAERHGSAAEAMCHFEMAHRLRPLAFPFPIELSTSDWQLVLSNAFAALPPELQAFWREVPVKLEHFPDPVDLTEPVPPISPRIAALYEGKPSNPPVPDARPKSLRIYRGNLAHAESPDALMAQLLHALEQEALDWLPPMDEDAEHAE
jgi:tetratricopeptide (TPR) repeat protein